MKTIITSIVLALALSFTVQAQAVTPVEKVSLSGNYLATNVPASDLAAKQSDALAQCPSGKKVFTQNCYLSPVTGLYTVSAIYR